MVAAKLCKLCHKVVAFTFFTKAQRRAVWLSHAQTAMNCEEFLCLAGQAVMLLVVVTHGKVGVFIFCSTLACFSQIRHEGPSMCKRKTLFISWLACARRPRMMAW